MTKKQIQLKFTSRDEEIKHSGTHDTYYAYKLKQYSFKRQSCSVYDSMNGPEHTVLSEINQRTTEIYKISIMCEIENNSVKKAAKS